MFSFPVLFILNWLIGILLVEFAYIKTKAVRHVDEARDSKYPAFRRTDIHLWSRPRLYLFAIFLPFRFLCGIAIPINLFVFMK